MDFLNAAFLFALCLFAIWAGSRIVNWMVAVLNELVIFLVKTKLAHVMAVVALVMAVQKMGIKIPFIK